MSCKFFKIEDAMSGSCRVQAKETGDNTASSPMVRQDHTCDKWVDCGQQYYIRLGWVRSQEGKKGSEPAQ